MLSKKYYKALAEIISKRYVKAKLVDRIPLRLLTTDLIGFLEKDNPSFDRERFLDACGFTI